MVELPTARNNGILRALGELQVDVVVGFVLLVGAATSVLYVDSVVIRALFGIPLLVFLPGYALLLVLFPHTYTDTRLSQPSLVSVNRNRPGVTFVERVALSFGLSLALIPLLGVLVLSLFPQAGPATIVGLFSAFVGVGLLVGEYRRQHLTEPERYDLPVKQWYSSVVGSFSNETNTNRVVNGVLAVVVVLSVVGLGAALVAPNYGESYTDLSLVTEGSNGAFVAAGYPQALSAGNDEIYASVTNHERATTQYTLVVQLQRVETSAGSAGSASVVEYEELARVSSSVAPGETWSTNPELNPEMTGTDLRLVYLLYKGDAPEDATVENAYRSTFVWVDN